MYIGNNAWAYICACMGTNPHTTNMYVSIYMYEYMCHTGGFSGQ